MTRDQIANIHWIIEKAREFFRKSTSASLTTLKSLTMWLTTNCGKLEMGISGYLTSLLRNLYAGKEETVRTRHRTMDLFQIGKGKHQVCILSPCLFNLYTELLFSCVRLCDPRACSTPDLPVHHQLLEFTQTHVHQVSDAIQPSHPLSFLHPFSSRLQSFPASGSFPMSQFFTSGSQSIGVSASTSVLPMNIQD